MKTTESILPNEWYVLGPVKKDDPIPAYRKPGTAPARRQVGAPPPASRKGLARKGQLDLAPFIRGTTPEKTAFVFIPFSISRTADVCFGFGADWWFEAFVDGKRVCDTIQYGNRRWPPTSWDYAAVVPLSRGPHLLTIRLISGTGSSTLCAAASYDITGALARARFEFETWPVDELTRVFPQDAPPRNAAALRRAGWSLSSPKGAYCVFQLGLLTHAPLENVEIIVGSLRAGNDVIPSEAITVRRVGLVPLLNPDQAERPEYTPGWYPDPLLEDAGKDVWSADPWARSAAVCFILRVPPETPPGDYRGVVTARYRDQFRSEIPVALRVWPFALPQRPNHHVTNWFQPDCVTKWHRCEPWSERHWKILDLYAATMAAYRQDTIITPTLTGNFHNSDQMVLVDAVRTRTGNYRFDFERLERWVKLFDRHGFRFFEMWHLAEAGHGKVAPPLKVFDERQGRTVRLENLPVLGPEYRRLVGSFLRELSGWLEARGLSKRFLLHVYDEPRPETWPHYTRLGAFCRRHAPKLKQIDAISKSDLLTSAHARLDLPVPLTTFVDHDPYYRQRAKKGKQDVWWYTCCAPGTPYANRFVRCPLIETRILSWQAFTFHIAGYLHWGYNFWHRTGQDESGRPGISRFADQTLLNPYREHPTDWPTGDAAIVYPHPRWWEEHGPISSLRYEAHRAGLQDYELLRMLQRVADRPGTTAFGAQAKKLLAAVHGPLAGSLTDFTRDGALLLRTRRAIGDCIADSMRKVTNTHKE